MAIVMKAGDTAPVVKATLLDEAGDPVDLTGATVMFVMADNTEPRTAVVEAAGVLVDAVNGVVSYVWAAGDTATAGSYVAEFEVVYADASRQTFPTEGYIEVTIVEDLGGTA